jgi:hypothetical protein
VGAGGTIYSTNTLIVLMSWVPDFQRVNYFQAPFAFCQLAAKFVHTGYPFQQYLNLFARI